MLPLVQCAMGFQEIKNRQLLGVRNKNRNKLIITAGKRENMQFTKWFLSYCDLWIFIFCCLRCVSPSGLLLCQHVYQFQVKHRIPGLGQNLQNKSNTMIICNNQNKTVCTCCELVISLFIFLFLFFNKSKKASKLFPFSRWVLRWRIKWI